MKIPCHNILEYSQRFSNFLQQSFAHWIFYLFWFCVENFNIFTNNITSVETAKINAMYTSDNFTSLRKILLYVLVE